MKGVLAALEIVTLASGSFAMSGCLLDRKFTPADVYVTPLRVPVILEDPGATGGDPLPGSIVTLEPGVTQKNISFVVRYESNDVLIARAFVDRQRPCSSSSNTCGQQLNVPPLTAQDGGVERSRNFDVPIRDPNKCYVVDLYLSPEFQSSQVESAHEPVRPGESAHARWYLLAPSMDGTMIPSINSCRQ